MTMNIIRLADADLDPAIVAEVSPRARRKIEAFELHTESDVALAAAEFGFAPGKRLDAFIIVADDFALRQYPDGLLAVKALRTWAEKSAPHILR